MEPSPGPQHDFLHAPYKGWSGDHWRKTCLCVSSWLGVRDLVLNSKLVPDLGPLTRLLWASPSKAAGGGVGSVGELPGRQQARCSGLRGWG